LLTECIQYNAADSPDALQTVRIRQQFPVGQIRANALTELNFSMATLSASEIFFVCELLVTSTSITLLDLSGTHFEPQQNHFSMIHPASHDSHHFLQSQGRCLFEPCGSKGSRRSVGVAVGCGGVVLQWREGVVHPADFTRKHRLFLLARTSGTCRALLTTHIVYVYVCVCVCVCGLTGSPLTMETADALVSTLVPNVSGRAHNTHLETLVCGASDTMPQCIGVYSQPLAYLALRAGPLP
jgi:hypothetical protein